MRYTNAIQFIARCACILLWIASAAFAQAKDTPSVRVVASFSILGDWVKQIGSHRVHIHSLIGPDSDAHVYKPRPRDARALGRASLVVVNGAGLEGWLDRLIEASGTRAPVVVVSDGIDWLPVTDADIGTEHSGHRHDDHEHDPHGWQTVSNARQYVKNITAALCTADAAGCVLYSANMDAYIQALESLDQDIRRLIRKVPRARRTAVTSHAAFRYFGQAYGIDFIAASGISTSAQARPATLAHLIKRMRAQRVNGIFLENVANTRLLEQVARDTGARIGGTLYSDALTGPDGPAPTYIDMMRHNATTLANALRDM